MCFCATVIGPVDLASGVLPHKNPLQLRFRAPSAIWSGSAPRTSTSRATTAACATLSVFLDPAARPEVDAYRAGALPLGPTRRPPTAAPAAIEANASTCSPGWGRGEREQARALPLGPVKEPPSSFENHGQPCAGLDPRDRLPGQAAPRSRPLMRG